MELAPFRVHGPARPGDSPAGHVQMELAPFMPLVQPRQHPDLQQHRIEVPEYPNHQQNNCGHPPASQRRPHHSDHMEHHRPRMPGSCRLHMPRIPAVSSARRSSARLTSASPAHSNNLPVPPNPGEKRVEVVHTQAPSSTGGERKPAPHRAWQQSMQRVADEGRQPEPQQRRRNDKARRADTCGTGDDGHAEDSGERQQ